MKKILQHALSITAMVACFTLTGCFKNFYTVKTNTEFEKLEALSKVSEKKIIVHYSDKTVALKSAKINAEQITGYLAPYLPAKAEYEEPDPAKRLNIYKYKHRKKLFNEVHVYANIPKPVDMQLTTIRKNEVTKYNTYKPAKGASIGSHILGVAVIAAIIALISVGLAGTTYYMWG